jgi:L-alanine-DL-glutamate epimerase-like enolase superfamily enzyme
MLRELSVGVETWPLAAPFRISRGVKMAAEVVVVEIREGEVVGRGEAVPYGRYGETVASVIQQVQGLAGEGGLAGLTPERLCDRLAPGAARNAVDCALWDLAASLSGRPVWVSLGLPPPPPIATALTVSLDEPEAMEAAAAKLADAPLVKVKVDASHPEAQIRAVRRAAPRARMIVDPNEGWDFTQLKALQGFLVKMRVDLVEQPIPADDDTALEGFTPAIPICADESCHTVRDLPVLKRRYQAVNIKLDKTGGLTEAIRLYEAAREAGFQVMAGCMVCTSLGIAPALNVAARADFADLDGPVLLRRDREGGVRLVDWKLHRPDPGFWGEPMSAGYAPGKSRSD